MQSKTVAPDAQTTELDPTAGQACSLAAARANASDSAEAPSCGCLPPRAAPRPAA